MAIPKTQDLFDLSFSHAGELLRQCEYPWEALAQIAGFIIKLGESLPEDEYIRHGEGIWISKSANVAPSASVAAPCIIGAGAEVRHCAFIRGAALIGRGAVLGNSCEIKNSILFDGAQAPHFNYIGDSILGRGAHMGAGAITSNLKSDKTLIAVKSGTDTIETGLKKIGAMLGDFVEIGCNSVLNPGSIVGRGTSVYPLSSVRGVIPENSIYKGGGMVIAKR